MLWQWGAASPLGFAIWRTQENHRSSRSIARYVDRTLGLTMDARHDLPVDAEQIAYNNAHEQINRAAEHTEALVQRDYRPEQIAILTAHARDKSPFAAVESAGGYRLRSHTGYREDGHEGTTAGKLTLDRIHRYKGQQAPGRVPELPRCAAVYAKYGNSPQISGRRTRLR